MITMKKMSNEITEHHIIDNSIFRIGDVVEIIGQSVKVKVDTWKNTSSILYKWDIIQNISVWGYKKMIWNHGMNNWMRIGKRK